MADLSQDQTPRDMKDCECKNWCRAEVDPKAITNHHPWCKHYNDSLIDVWLVEFGGIFYVSDHEPTADEITGGETVTKEKMHRELFEQLPEFEGF
jgi:hypothetical protein